MDGVELASLLKALQSQVTLLQGTLANQINASENRLLVDVGQIRGTVAELHGLLSNQVNRGENLILAEVSSLEKAIERLAARIDTITPGRLSLLQTRGIAAIVNGRHISQRPGPVVVRPQPALPLDEQIAGFRKAAPLNIDAWLQAFEFGAKHYDETSVGNFSHDGHVGANYFRMFVNIHARGRILDLGCGQLPLPEYLRDWAIDQMAGMDPLAPHSEHPFPFAQTFAENLPWPESSFETVIVGTSLDHVYLLDVVLAEIKRVLTPSGRLLVWTTLLPQSAPYDPYSGKIAVSDEFHLFHPGRNWFYTLFSQDYRLVEAIETVNSAELIAFERH